MWGNAVVNLGDQFVAIGCDNCKVRIHRQRQALSSFPNSGNPSVRRDHLTARCRGACGGRRGAQMEQLVPSVRLAHRCWKISSINRQRRISLSVGCCPPCMIVRFGVVLLFLGLLATAPIGSIVPGLLLAVVAFQMITGRREPVFPRFITARGLPTRYLLWVGERALFLYCDILKRQFIHVGRLLSRRPNALSASWSFC